MERKGIGIRVISSVSILGTFGGMALLKWYGSLGQQGEGFTSLGDGTSIRMGGFLLLGLGLIVGVALIRFAVRKVLNLTREQELWLETSAEDRTGGLFEDEFQIQMDLTDDHGERYWELDPALWSMEQPVGDE